MTNYRIDRTEYAQLSRQRKGSLQQWDFRTKEESFTMTVVPKKVAERGNARER